MGKQGLKKRQAFGEKTNSVKKNELDSPDTNCACGQCFGEVFYNFFEFKTFELSFTGTGKKSEKNIVLPKTPSLPSPEPEPPIPSSPIIVPTPFPMNDEPSPQVIAEIAQPIENIKTPPFET